MNILILIKLSKTSLYKYLVEITQWNFPLTFFLEFKARILLLNMTRKNSLKLVSRMVVR